MAPSAVAAGQIGLRVLEIVESDEPLIMAEGWQIA
jgi:hypothetical protein